MIGKLILVGAVVLILALTMHTTVQSNNTTICPQVITYASSGDECRVFPTPCDIPNNWTVVDKCQNMP